MTRGLILGTLLLTACGSGVARQAATAPEPQRPSADGESGAPAVCEAPAPDVIDLVERLDEDPDPLHTDITPSVTALSSLDLRGACAVLDALESTDVDTRLHAQRVLEMVVTRRCGFIPGFGFTSQHGDDGAREVLIGIGFDYDAEPQARHEAAGRWRRWVQDADAFVCDGASGAPPVAALRAALEPVAPELRRCGEPVDVTVTFEGSGTISSIYGADRGADYNRCVEAAVQGISVGAFDRDEVWIRYAPGLRAP